MALNIEKKIDFNATHAGKLWADEFNKLEQELDNVILASGDNADDTTGVRRTQLLTAITNMTRSTHFKVDHTAKTFTFMVPLGTTKNRDGNNETPVIKPRDKELFLIFTGAGTFSNSNYTIGTSTITVAYNLKPISALNVPSENAFVFGMYDDTSKSINLIPIGGGSQSSTLPTTTALNDIKETGTHNITDTTGITNLPTTERGILNVVGSPPNISQVYTDATGTVYIRGSIDGGVTWTSWISKIPPKVGTKPIVENDLNKNLVDGKYYQNDPTKVTTANGYPQEAVGVKGLLRSNVDGNNIIQEYVTKDGVYIRSSPDGGTTWTAWKTPSKSTTSVPNGTQLNTLVKDGRYAIDSTAPNNPTGNAGSLDVIQSGTTTIQSFTDGKGLIYSRTSADGGATWSNWVENVPHVSTYIGVLNGVQVVPAGVTPVTAGSSMLSTY